MNQVFLPVGSHYLGIISQGLSSCIRNEFLHSKLSYTLVSQKCYIPKKISTNEHNCLSGNTRLFRYLFLRHIATQTLTSLTPKGMRFWNVQ